MDKDEKQVSNQLVVSYTLVQLHVFGYTMCKDYRIVKYYIYIHNIYIVKYK